jgi:hypothetical protein
VLDGSPAAQGRQMAWLAGQRVAPLLRAARVRLLPETLFHGDRSEQWVARMDPAHRDEIDAFAAALGRDAATLRRANVLVDSQCSALVSPARTGQPLLVARNMDFFPAGLIGRHSTLIIQRRPDRLAVASIGWPGYAGVVSGMNAKGLTACVLLHHGMPRHDDGVPVCFRIRELLETCPDVASAAAALHHGPRLASGHYILLADASTSALLWQDTDGIRQDDPVDGWLAASNWGRRDGRPTDRRGRLMLAAANAAQTHGWNRDTLRASIGPSRLWACNAQAMVFVPGERSLDLAIGDALRPAATQDWWRMDLGPVLDGQAPTAQPWQALSSNITAL